MLNQITPDGVSPLLSNGPVHFCFKGCRVVFFIFIQILIENSAHNSEDPDPSPHSAVSDMGLHCFTMFMEKEARLTMTMDKTLLC